jgi:hypothetical protein
MTREVHVVYWIRGGEHAQLARLSIASVRNVYPDARVFVYSDDPLAQPLGLGEVTYRLAPGEPAMVANLTAQVKHLASASFGLLVLFLDADTLVREAFPFDAGHDLFVTWRGHSGYSNGEKVTGVAELMPYNYGVIGARVCASVIEAFLALRTRVQQLAPRYQDWYGNQLALADLIGAPPKEGAASVTVPVRWAPTAGGTPLRVRQLPCEVWNFSPESEADDVSGKGILHMKGGRKHLMQHFASRAA